MTSAGNNMMALFTLACSMSPIVDKKFDELLRAIQEECPKVFELIVDVGKMAKQEVEDA